MKRLFKLATVNS